MTKTHVSEPHIEVLIVCLWVSLELEKKMLKIEINNQYQ